MTDLSDYLTHILCQTRQNINFLISHHKLGPTDGSDILAKLPDPNDSSLPTTIDIRSISVSPLHITPNPHPLTPLSINGPVSPIPEPNSPSESVPAAQSQPQLIVRARALWDYKNEESTTDLSFRAGDIIEITAEPHNDWWSGRNLKQGLFPSNYVEKITAAAGVLSPDPSLSPISSRSTSSSPPRSLPSSPPTGSQHVPHHRWQSVSGSTLSQAAPFRRATGPRSQAPHDTQSARLSSSPEALRSLPKISLSTVGR